MNEEPNDEDNEDVEDEGPVERSFFTSINILDVSVHDHHAWDEIEAADAAAALRVWNIFAKDSTARGFDCRSRSSINASKALAKRREAEGAVLAPPTHIEETTMKKRGEMLTMVGDAQRVFIEKHRRVPHPKELFELLGETTAVSVENVRATMKRIAAKAVGGAKTSSKAKVAPRTAAAPKAPAPAAAKVSGDPIVANLITKRDELRRKADALDTAIGALT